MKVLAVVEIVMELPEHPLSTVAMAFEKTLQEEVRFGKQQGAVSASLRQLTVLEAYDVVSGDG